MRLGAWNPAVIREHLSTREVETGESICSSDPCRSGWASVLFSRRNILPGGSSRLGRPRYSQFSLARQREGLVSGRRSGHSPHCLEPCTRSLFLEILFSNVFSRESVWGFFPSSFFYSPLCVWLRGPVAAAPTAGEKLEPGFVGRPTLELPASVGLPSSARDTAATATILGSPAADASCVGPGPLPWGPETAATVCIDFHKLPPPPTSVLQDPYPGGGVVPQPTGRSSSVLPAADAACDSPRRPPAAG